MLWRGRNRLNFVGDPVSFVDPGSFLGFFTNSRQDGNAQAF